MSNWVQAKFKARMTRNKMIKNTKIQALEKLKQTPFIDLRIFPSLGIS